MIVGSAYYKEWRARRTPEQIQTQLANQRKYYHANKERQREIKRAYAARLRKEAVDALGGNCACCGESRPKFLAIDHIQGGGRADRGTSYGPVYYNRIKKQGYPRDKYRVLCHNCNQGRELNDGICPHEEER